ncbi:TPA: glycosyltransferase, partial [Citrobacter freundii]
MIYISIISHGHESIIDKFKCVDKLSNIENVKIVIKDNKANGHLMKKYSSSSQITVLDDHSGLGFGANNNYVFNYCRDVLGASDDDYFLIMNPDINIDESNFLKLKELVDENN